MVWTVCTNISNAAAVLFIELTQSQLLGFSQCMCQLHEVTLGHPHLIVQDHPHHNILSPDSWSNVTPQWRIYLCVVNVLEFSFSLELLIDVDMNVVANWTARYLFGIHSGNVRDVGFDDYIRFAVEPLGMFWTGTFAT